MQKENNNTENPPKTVDISKEKWNNVTVGYTEISQKGECQMNAKRWNELIGMVNAGNSFESVKSDLSEKEAKIYRNMEKELAEMRGKDPKAAFYPVESEY